MVNNKNILRTALLLSYVLVIVFLIYGVSALYSYLNTGADRSSMLHTEVKKVDQYLPQLEWAPLTNEGREMDMQTLLEIENDYIDAWYVRHIAYKTNLKAGVKDYYTDNARKNIFNLIEKNKSEKITIDATTLKHNLEVVFFSEDGQFAVLEDKNIVEYKRVYKNLSFVFETVETATYKIIVLLEDGFWRIRHLVKEKVSPNSLPSKAIDSTLNIKGINYYPKDTPWDMFGDKFDIKIIDTDFKIIKNAGLNSIRIFVPYEDFGKATIIDKKLEKLKQVLDTAEANNLKVVVTLFDFFGDYAVINWTLNIKHIRDIVSKFKDHKAIIAWDIKNEPDLDFKSRGKKSVTSWLTRMIAIVKSIDKTHPVTIGWSNAKSAIILKDKVDFVSFHYYKNVVDFSSTYQNLKTLIPNKQIVLTEFGVSSWRPIFNSSKKQAAYHKTMQQQIKKENVSFMSWTLYDFKEVPVSVVGKIPWRRNPQKYFGFITKKGNKKSSFKYITVD